MLRATENTEYMLEKIENFMISLVNCKNRNNGAEEIVKSEIKFLFKITVESDFI